jgi:nucleoside-diphosphate-sugar epimerase
MRVLVTGAGGFVGSNLVREMIRDGAEVIALCHEENPRRLQDVKVERRVADVLGPEIADVVHAIAPDACAHLAWFISPGTHPTSTKNVEHVAASMRLLEALDAAGCARTLITGTCWEQDPSRGVLDENTAALPQNFYAACKHALHVMAASFQKMKRRGFAWARLFNTYGPWEYAGPLVPDVVSNLLAGKPCALTSGAQERDYLHIEDVASALWAILKSGADGDFNVGSSQPVRVAEVAEAIGRLLGRPELLKFADRAPSPFDCPRLYADATRLRSVTGWRPRLGLEEGLARTIEWYRSDAYCPDL